MKSARHAKSHAAFEQVTIRRQTRGGGNLASIMLGFGKSVSNQKFIAKNIEQETLFRMPHFTPENNRITARSGLGDLSTKTGKTGAMIMPGRILPYVPRRRHFSEMLNIRNSWVKNSASDGRNKSGFNAHWNGFPLYTASDE